MKKKNVFILSLISSFVFIGSIAYGVTRLFEPAYICQATLIIIESTVGLILCFLPPILKKFFKIEMAFILYLFIHLFLILAIFIGETFEFYYRVSWWDDVLHILSGFGVAFIAYCLVYMCVRKTNINNKVLVSIFMACLASLTFGVIWEVIEFSLDSLFGTNMQKFMPEVPNLFNGGASFDSLNGTDSEIAEFFKNGYRYALLDTMTDLVDCVIGTIGFIAFAKIANRKFPYALKDLIRPTTMYEVISEELECVNI